MQVNQNHQRRLGFYGKMGEPERPPLSMLRAQRRLAHEQIRLAWVGKDSRAPPVLSSRAFLMKELPRPQKKSMVVLTLCFLPVIILGKISQDIRQ